MGLFLSPLTSLLVSDTAVAAPELRWITYVQAKGVAGLADYRGSVEAVRSDGREGRSLIPGTDVFFSVDVGPEGVVYAVGEGIHAEIVGPVTSILRTTVDDIDAEALYEVRKGTHYLGVSASSEGRVAIFRLLTKTQHMPQFLSGGIDVLASTNVPVLVPPQEPPGTGGLVPNAEEDSYHLLFTNDPAGELAHVGQVNVFVDGVAGGSYPVPGYESQPVDVRGTNGRFYCGASACFLTWQELGVTYTVGEFGANAEAVAFAESLIPIETVAGALWREGVSASPPTPELVVRGPSGQERILESVEGFCECGFRPLDWSSTNDRLLVLVSAEGATRLREYSADGSAETKTIAGGTADPEGRDVILDAAYGPDGIVALFGGEGGPPGTLREVGGDVLITDVRAFDIEGSTLAYVLADGDVVVKDLSSGNERTVGEGAIDVSVGPDVIGGSSTSQPPPGKVDGSPVVVVALIAGGVLTLLAGATLLGLSRRRERSDKSRNPVVSGEL